MFANCRGFMYNSAKIIKEKENDYEEKIIDFNTWLNNSSDYAAGMREQQGKYGESGFNGR